MEPVLVEILGRRSEDLRDALRERGVLDRDLAVALHEDEQDVLPAQPAHEVGGLVPAQ